MKRLLVIVPIALLAGCGAPSNPGCCENTAINKSIASYQQELLECAFDGVSKMPLRPHIKNRSRAQQKVVDTCLELGQPALARSYIEKIDNWHRWLGHANLACYYAEKGDFENAGRQLDKVQPALRMAEEHNKGLVVAATPNPLYDSLRDWRYEAVLSRVTEVQMLMQNAAAENVDAEMYGELNASRLNLQAALWSEDDFEASMALLQSYIEDPNFEIVHVGFLKIADLFREHYDQVDLPEFVEQEMVPRTEKMPVFLRIEILEHLAEAALDNEDNEAAALLLERMQALVDGLSARPQFHIPEAARLIRLRFVAGQTKEARSQMKDLGQSYAEARELIVSMYRAELLCRMAEVHVVAGDVDQALELYTDAVAEGQLNPNSRPQADDLNEICCSMALAGVEPTPSLRAKLLEMNQNLGEPW